MHIQIVRVLIKIMLSVNVISNNSQNFGAGTSVVKRVTKPIIIPNAQERKYNSATIDFMASLSHWLQDGNDNARVLFNQEYPRFLEALVQQRLFKPIEIASIKQFTREFGQKARKAFKEDTSEGRSKVGPTDYFKAKVVEIMAKRANSSSGTGLLDFWDGGHSKAKENILDEITKLWERDFLLRVKP